MTDQDFLAHYGILGMKWGKRKRTSSDTTPNSEEHTKSRTLKKKPISKMTNSELQSYVNRMNLEQQYKQLKSKDVSSGQKFVQGLITDIGKEIVRDTIKSSLKSVMKKKG